MKLFKKYYFIVALILTLCSVTIYGTYSLYTTGADFSNVVNVGTDITYKFDINNTESIGVSNNSNFRFKGSLTNTIGSDMEYKFYYKIDGASSGVTVKEVANSTSAMKSSGSIANNATITPEFYITNTSGSNITVTVGVSFAYSGNTVTLDNGTSAISSTITSSAAKTGNCTTTGYTTEEAASLSPSGKTLQRLGLESKVKSGTPNFSSVATTDEGIYIALDDYGFSYYFRGAVENNYVKFAGAYWRIIRINGDGTIRMIFDGETSAHANGESSRDRHLWSDTMFGISKDDNAYVGFMYGSTGQSGDNAYANTHANTNSSIVKGVLDTWYGTISAENQGYIADSIFCGDRTVISDGSYLNYKGNGTGAAQTAYGAIIRLEVNRIPILTCPNKNDRYTVSDTAKGNGSLTNPVGLITADEVAMAGSAYGKENNSYYLYTGDGYWTMSPSCFNDSYAYVFFVSSSGGFGNGGDIWRYVRPVINLKSDIIFSGGKGTKDAPWIVGTGNV